MHSSTQGTTQLGAADSLQARDGETEAREGGDLPENQGPELLANESRFEHGKRTPGLRDQPYPSQRRSPAASARLQQVVRAQGCDVHGLPASTELGASLCSAAPTRREEWL